MSGILKTAGLVAILILAVFFRFFDLASLPPGLYPDEAMNGNNALEALTTAPPAGGFKAFYPENTGREGLFINIQAVFLKFILPFADGWPEPWMLRLPSAVFGVLTVLGIYFLAKKLFASYSIGLLSAFFTATSFWHINFSRIGFRAIMAPFFLTWAIYFLIKAFEGQKSKFCILSSAFAGLFFGLGFHSYIAYRITPLLILFIFWFYWRATKKKNELKRFLIPVFCFLFSVFIVVLPLGLYFLNHPQDFFGRTSQISVFQSQTPLKDFGLNILKTAGMFNVAGDENWRHNIAGKPLLFWPVGIIFLIGLINGVGAILKKSKTDSGNLKFGFRLLMLWLVVAALPVVVSNEGLPHALRAILMAPPVFILSALGGQWLYRKLLAKFDKNERVITLIKLSVGLLIFAAIFEAYIAYFIQWGENLNTAGAFNQKYVAEAEKIKALPNEMPKYVIVKAGGVDVRGWPMSTQTVMFLTDSFTEEKQIRKNIFYVKAEQENILPKNLPVFMID